MRNYHVVFMAGGVGGKDIHPLVGVIKLSRK